MSLYGALFTGVSGLGAQGQKLGVISDNIANVNTIGYKESESQFQTMVVNAAAVTAFNPGGVRATTRYNVDKQGLMLSTSAPTDIAISGQGFFVVSANSDGSGQPLYTRAGSFRQDADGNMVNSQGFYLRAWPLDESGRLPGDPGNINTVSSSNIDSLQTVNVANLGGEAKATENLELSLNLDAEEDVYPGETVTINMDGNSPNNYHISGSDIIVPDEASAVIPPANFGLATPNNLTRGDGFTVTTGAGLTFDYFYGGFTMGRDVTTTGSTNIGDGGTSLAPNNLAAGAVAGPAAIGGNTFTVTAAAHGLVTGDRVRIGSFAWAGAETIPLSEINTTHTVTVTGVNTFTFQSTSLATVGGDANAAAPVTTWTTRLFTGNVLDATSVSTSLIDPSSLSNYTANARSFTITTATAGTATFTYKASSPSTLSGEFNNLTSLAQAINNFAPSNGNASAGFNARVVGGRLVVGSKDATEAVTFANVDASGSNGLLGIDWVTELDLSNVSAGARRFSTMNNLSDLIANDDGISASVINPLGEATMDIWVDDPLDTIRFQDYVGPSQLLAGGELVSAAGSPSVITVTIAGHGLTSGQSVVLSGMTPFDTFSAADLNTSHTVTVTGPNTFTISVIPSGGAAAGGAANVDGSWAVGNTGSLLAEFGLTDEAGNILVPTLTGGTFVRGDTGALGPKYDASAVIGDNMASGQITPDYSRSVRIYDALGVGHDIQFSFIKTAENQWAVEIYAAEEDEISTPLVNGQIATGTINFNGDGSLRSLSTDLLQPLNIHWTNGAAVSTVAFDLGTAGVPFGTPGATLIGDTDGLRQFSGGYDFTFGNQDGAPTGELVGISIDADGFIVASFSNGEQSQIYKIPIADFQNPNGLKPLSGNVYAETNESGNLLLREAGDDGVGTVVSGSLEQSNVDLAEQLTSMIVAQRAYQSNTRVISTTDQLLEQLNQL